MSAKRPPFPVSAKRLTDSSLLISAVFYGVLLALAVAAGLFGIWLGFILLLSLWRYAYAVLRATAQGRREIPPPEIETLNPVGEMRLVVHFIAFPALVIMLATVQPFGASGFGLALNWAAIAAAAYVFPASAIMMGLTSGLEAAFHPANLARVIKALDRHYVVLAAASVGLVLGAGLLSAYVLPAFGLLARIARNVLAVWTMLAIFALIGELLRAHRTQFQIPGEIESEEERRGRELRREWRKTLDLAYASIRSGLLAEGYETLRRLSAQHGDGPEIQYWLFENMLEWEDRRHALEVARRLIERHVAGGDLYAGLELFARCRRHARDFSVLAPAAAPLASFARSIGRHGLADELQASGSIPTPGL